MKKVVYKLKKECTTSHCVSYGVEVFENGIQTQYVPNVSNKKRYAKKLVRTCNKNHVDPIHLRDLIEDMSWEIMRAEKQSCV